MAPVTVQETCKDPSVIILGMTAPAHEHTSLIPPPNNFSESYEPSYMQP